VAGDDEDGPAVLEPVVGGDARPAAPRRLHDHDHDDVGERDGCVGRPGYKKVKLERADTLWPRKAIRAGILPGSQ
jgi:hypothetical protein